MLLYHLLDVPNQPMRSVRCQQVECDEEAAKTKLCAKHRSACEHVWREDLQEGEQVHALVLCLLKQRLQSHSNSAAIEKPNRVDRKDAHMDPAIVAFEGTQGSEVAMLRCNHPGHCCDRLKEDEAKGD